MKSQKTDRKGQKRETGSPGEHAEKLSFVLAVRQRRLSDDFSEHTAEVLGVISVSNFLGNFGDAISGVLQKILCFIDAKFCQKRAKESLI